MSFLDIIREQEDERLAKKMQYLEQDNYNSYYYDELHLAIAQSLSEPPISQPPTSQPQPPKSWASLTKKESEAKPPVVSAQYDSNENDLMVATVQQLMEDQELALFLQKKERVHFGEIVDEIEAKKKLSPLEYKLYHQKFGVDEESSESDEDEETEFDYTEPAQVNPKPNQIEVPILYDSAQRREDKEISTIPKRMAEKRINSAPIATHHKDFYTDKQKRGIRAMQRATRKPLPRPEDLANIPKRDDNHEYALVLRSLGGRRFRVFCYHNCTEIICWLPGKFKKNNTWVVSGNIILYKVRKYQLNRGDMVERYNDYEYEYLKECGELKECDPRKQLPLDIIKKILQYLDLKSRNNFWQVYKATI